MLAAASAVVGYVVGLFLNPVIDQVPRRESLRPARFRCDRCPEGVDAVPGLPFVAWIVPGASCPACGERLARRYFLVPPATAVLFALTAARLGAGWALPAHLLVVASLVAITVVDLRLKIIPNRIVYPTIFASVPLLAAAAVAGGDLDALWRALLGATLAWTGLLVVHLVSPSAMGFGDVRLAFVLGLFLGWSSLGLVLGGLFLGFLLAAVAGVALALARVTSLKAQIPFGPFMAAGALLAILLGDHLGPLALSP